MQQPENGDKYGFLNREQMLWWEVASRTKTKEFVDIELASSEADWLGLSDHQTKIELIGRVLEWVAWKEMIADISTDKLVDIMLDTETSGENKIRPEDLEWIRKRFILVYDLDLTRTSLVSLIDYSVWMKERYQEVIDDLKENGSLKKLRRLCQMERYKYLSLERQLGDEEYAAAVNLEKRAGLSFDQVRLLSKFWSRVFNYCMEMDPIDIADMQQNTFNFNLN